MRDRRQPLQPCPTPYCKNFKLRGRGRCGPCISKKIATAKKHVEADLPALDLDSLKADVESRRRTIRFMLGGQL